MLITRRNLSDEVQERILELIADGSIAMGSKIDFNSLQEMFGVSRASVREGVQRLMGKGVLESAGPRTDTGL